MCLLISSFAVRICPKTRFRIARSISQITFTHPYPASILHKSIAGLYWSVRVADGPITARYRFIKYVNWEAAIKLISIIIKLHTFIHFCHVLICSSHTTCENERTSYIKLAFAQFSSYLSTFSSLNLNISR